MMQHLEYSSMYFCYFSVSFFFSVFFLCLFSFVFCVYLIYFPPRPTAKSYDRTEHGEVQKVLCNSRRLGKITNFHVVGVVLLDVIKFYVFAVVTVRSFRYGQAQYSVFFYTECRYVF